MEVVATPILAPGCCITCAGSAGPQVDTRRTNRFGERVYVCVECIRTLEQMLPARVERVAPDVAELQARLDEAQAKADRFDALRDAIHYTIQHGGFVIRRGKIALRSRPGRPSVDL